MFETFTLNLRGKLHVYDRPQVMGIVNVTPDSFWSGSRSQTFADIASRVEQMLSAGGDFIDIGGCSTRPGSAMADESTEMERVRLGLSAIRSVSTDVPVSVDTFRSGVARLAVAEWGADIVNDISGGDMDADMFRTVAALGVPYVLMHMRGTPETMQQFTDYVDPVADVIRELSVKLRELRLAGVSDVIVDPGFGFSKTVEQNYRLLSGLTEIARALGAPVLAGVSRKSMITKALGVDVSEAMAGTIALGSFLLDRGTSFLRVHDVKEARATVDLFTLIDRN